MVKVISIFICKTGLAKQRNN